MFAKKNSALRKSDVFGEAYIGDTRGDSRHDAAGEQYVIVYAVSIKAAATATKGIRKTVRHEAAEDTDGIGVVEIVVGVSWRTGGPGICNDMSDSVVVAIIGTAVESSTVNGSDTVDESAGTVVGSVTVVESVMVDDIVLESGVVLEPNVVDESAGTVVETGFSVVALALTIGEDKRWSRASWCVR